VQTIDRARLSGFGAMENSLSDTLAQELQISAESMGEGPGANDLIPHGLDALWGWIANRKS
jgi:hypothetical protein